MTDQPIEPMTSSVIAWWKERVTTNLWDRDVLSLMARLDAEIARANAAEAERDAALARALPEARLVQTKEEARQLPAGTYYVSAPEAGEGWFAVEALDAVSGRRWLYLDPDDLRSDYMVVGCLVIRLPDIPIPTTSEEG